MTTQMAGLPPCPELDALIAEKILGVAGGYIDPNEGYMRPTGLRVYPYEQFNPSRSISSAWEVVEKLTDPSFPRRPDGFPPSTMFMLWWEKQGLWTHSAKEAAHAICLAALEAIK